MVLLPILVCGCSLLPPQAIPNFGADTFYPAEDRHGNFMSGFDDGGILAVSVNSASPSGRGSTTGSAIVSGGSRWRHLTVQTAGGALREDGFPMKGRYTSANAVVNGTWWTGTYGLGLSYATNSLSIEVVPIASPLPCVCVFAQVRHRLPSAAAPLRVCNRRPPWIAWPGFPSPPRSGRSLVFATPWTPAPAGASPPLPTARLST